MQLASGPSRQRSARWSPSVRLRGRRVAVGLRRLLGRRHRGHPGRGRVLPAAVRRRAGRRRPRRGHQPHPARRGAARPRADDPGDRGRSPGPTWWSTSAASSRRSTTAVDQNATGDVLDAADVGPRAGRASRPARPALLAGPAADGRRSATRVAAELGDGRPGARRRRTTPTPARLRRQLTALDTAYADGLADCARAHDRGLARRLRLPRASTACAIEPIAGLSPDAEPTPADLARLQELIRDRRASPRSSPSGWPAPG